MFLKKNLKLENFKLMNWETQLVRILHMGNDNGNVASGLQDNSMTTHRSASPEYEIFRINSKM